MSRPKLPERSVLLPCMATALTAGILFGRLLSESWPGFVILGIYMLAALLLPKRFRVLSVSLTVLATGIVLGQAAYHPAMPPEGEYTVNGVITDEVMVNTQTGQVRTRLSQVTLNGERAPSDAWWSFYTDSVPEELKPGMQIQVTASVYHPDGAENPGGFDFRNYLLGLGIHYGLYGGSDLQVTGTAGCLKGRMAALRDQLTRNLVDALGERAGGYAAAMLLGGRSLLDADEREAYSRLGIAHILSISGFHVGILVLMLSLLLKRSGTHIRFAVTAAVLVFYCLLTGLRASVIRASVLALLAMLRRMTRRQLTGLWTLLGSWMITLILFPAQLTQSGFHLTYAAVLGILMAVPAIRGLTDRFSLTLPAPVQRLTEALAVSLGAQLGLLLPEMYWFQEVPLTGLLLNLAVLPLASVLIIGCWIVLLTCRIPFVGTLIAGPMKLMLNGMTDAVLWLKEFAAVRLWTGQSNAVTLIAWGILMAALGGYLMIRRKRVWIALAAAAVMTASMIHMPHTATEYIQFSVGNADAAVLWDRDRVLVIDTGETGEEIASWLKQKRLRVDDLILTHLHADHADGMEALKSEGIPVRRLWLSTEAEKAAVTDQTVLRIRQTEQDGTETLYLSRGDTIPLEDGELTVVWPEKGKTRPGQDANESSLVLLARIEKTVMLLTGDLDGDYENYCIQPADILKVAHHGSTASSGEEFLSCVSPQTAILSCGDTRRRLVMEEKLAGRCRLFTTDTMGAVRITFEQDGYTVSTMKGNP